MARRVLHVAEAYGGGLMEVVRWVAEGSAAAGHESAIAYGRRPETPKDVRATVNSAVDLYELPWSRRHWRSHSTVARELRRLVATTRPDVVHLHSSFAGVLGALALGGRVPLVFTPHAFASAMPSRGRAQQMLLEQAERLAVRRSALVAAVSESEARLARRLGAREVEVIPNGIPELDAGAPSLARPKAVPPRAVAAGRLIAQRRPHACARILAAVADAGEVRWLGGGGHEGAWGEEARAALEGAEVAITGWLPRESLLEEIAAAKVYLHWTEWDGMPLSILEAIAADTVVIAVRTEPSAEILPDAQLCDTEEEAIGLARRVLTDPDLERRLLEGQRARRNRHSARSMVDAWLEVYSRFDGVR